MARLLDPQLVIRCGRFPVTIAQGGLVPVAAFAGLFVVIASRTGVPLVTAAAFGAICGTASLVAHELGHAVAARSLRGVRPLGVSLVWLGAATRLEGRYDSGLEQVKVALAGPAVSLGIAASLAPTLLVPLPREARYLLAALAALNVTLAAVNLLPAKPLDGYNAVVGLLWTLTGSDARARRTLRRLAFAWAPFEVVGAAALLVREPFFGVLALATIAALLGQRLYVRVAPA